MIAPVRSRRRCADLNKIPFQTVDGDADDMRLNRSANIKDVVVK
jgi:hypothetical protein